MEHSGLDYREYQHKYPCEIFGFFGIDELWRLLPRLRATAIKKGAALSFESVIALFIQIGLCHPSNATQLL